MGWRDRAVPIDQVPTEGYPSPDPEGTQRALEQYDQKRAGFWGRAKDSFLLTPEGKRAFWEKERPDMKVSLDPAGEVVLEDPQTGVRQQANPPGADLGDVADFTPDILMGAATLPFGGTGSVMLKGAQAGLRRAG